VNVENKPGIGDRWASSAKLTATPSVRSNTILGFQLVNAAFRSKTDDYQRSLMDQHNLVARRCAGD
jgi:hypothetical protein